MGYRQGEMVGDYRGRGGYGLASARGDPGLFGFLGKVIGGVASVATGGLAGAVIKAGSTILGSSAGRAAVLRGAQVMYPGVAGIAQNPIGATMMPAPVSLPKGRQVVIPRKGAFEPTEVLSAGHGLRPRRRMNVTNAKALRRAIRRARGFEKLAKKVLGFTSPRKPKGRSYFRATRKR